MTDRMDLGGKLDFEKQDLTSPYAVISEIAAQVEAATRSYVKCKAIEYDGPINSYIEASGLLTFSELLSSQRVYDIQKDLGEIGSTEKKYELFLAADYFPNYKFRILFFSYKIGGYPVKLVLEQGVAKEFNAEKGSVEINSPEELKTAISSIISSKRIISIMQALIDASRQE